MHLNNIMGKFNLFDQFPFKVFNTYNEEITAQSTYEGRRGDVSFASS